jgi:hypothetical protein
MSEAAASSEAGSAAPVAAVTPAPEAALAAVSAAPVEQSTLLGGDPPSEVDAAAPDGDKPAAEAKTDGLPETYQIEIPEGETVDQPRLEAYQGVLKEAALTQEQANKLTPFLLGQMKQIQQQQQDAWADQTRQWRSSVESDPEIGGTNLRASLVNAARARDAYGSPELKALLADSSLGIGNHPAIVKLLAKVGAGMGEDLRPADRQFNAAADTRDKSAAAVGARMFGRA